VPPKDPHSVEALERFFASLSSTFVRYVVEVSGSEIRDDFDRRAVALYEEWWGAEASHLARAAGLLEGERSHPARGAFALAFSQYNYLGAGYLLRHVLERAQVEVEDLRALRADLAYWPEARALLDAAIGTEERFLEKARALEGTRPSAAPAASSAQKDAAEKGPRVKGTSAARW
jgi:hypothetical protein